MMQQTKPTLSTASLLWAKIGFLSFGGPAAQISLMHRNIVEEKGWLSEQQYLNALSFCMLLPGPEAMQIATYVGWRLHGVLGGLIAGILFILPGAAIIFAMAALYLSFGDIAIFQTLFLGVKAAVIVIVIEALLRVSKRTLKSIAHWLIAFFAFIALFFMDIAFPFVILAAAFYGFIFLKQETAGNVTVPLEISPWQSLKTVLLWSSLWFLPLVALYLFSSHAVLLEVGVFFSKLATVTFGGAYAVLSYMAQDAVQNKEWLSAVEMVDGLGLAETTPGPLILVTEFVGFLAGARAGLEGHSLMLGFYSALITLWVTFIPCFLWVFTGAPYIEWIASKKRLSNALQAISAAVVGVILNLSLWFALQVLFQDVQKYQYGILGFWIPNIETVDYIALMLIPIAMISLLKLKQSVLLTLVLCSFFAFIL